MFWQNKIIIVSEEITNKKEVFLNEQDYLFVKNINDYDIEEITSDFAAHAGLDRFIETALYFDAKYANDKLFGIGRTPAWVVEVGNIISSVRDKFTGIAFTGSWYKVNDDLGATRLVELEPTLAQITSFRQYLKKSALDPLSIVNRNMSKQKTILIDFISTGKGLISFCEIIINWAKELGVEEEVRKSIIIQDLTHLDDDLKEIVFKKKHLAYTSFPENYANYVWTHIANNNIKVGDKYPAIKYDKALWEVANPLEYVKPTRAQQIYLILLKLIEAKDIIKIQISD